MKKSMLLLSLIFTLLSNFLMAQAPVLKITSNQEKPVFLQELDVSVKIFGHLAETTMQMRFFNPNSRVLEGDLEFPMPEGAVVSGYALDINGILIDGVAVEKQKAREVFEAEVRKGIDPGLIEKVKGNNFKTRIYPIPASGSRIARVTYVSELKVDDSEASYRLPMQLSAKTSRSTLRVEVLSVDKKPEIKLQGVAAADFSRQKAGWFWETEIKSKDLSSELNVTVPVPDSGSVFVEKASDGNFYFSIQDRMRRPAVEEKKPVFKKISILFDASGSAEKRDLKLEKRFLENFMSSTRIADDCDVDLVVFRNSPAKPYRLNLGRGKSSGLIEYLDGILFDGGTSFAGLEDSISDDSDCVLVFSDGITTFGRSILPAIKVPVYSITSVAGSDYTFLRALCRKTGGQLINLNTVDMAKAVESTGAEFFGVTDKKTSEGIFEMLPEGAIAVNPDFMIVGRLEGENAEAVLSFGNRKTTVKDKTYRIDRSKAVDGDFLRRYWAGRKIDELFASKEKNRSEIIGLSKKHGIVNEFTSLIVLERVEQYLEHRVIPPATMPQWREQYFKVVEAESKAFESSRKNKLESVISMWENRLQWWQADFSKVKMLEKKDRDLSRDSLSMSAPAPRGAAMDMEDSFGGAPVPESAAPMEEREMAQLAPSMAARADVSEKKKSQSAGGSSVNPGVAIKAWEPDARYAKAIKESKDPMAEYFVQKKQYGNAPSFYLDVADVLISLKLSDAAVQVLSNIAELELENPALLRVLAHRLSQLEYLKISADIFSDVLEMRKEEPQSYRDLALVLGRMGEFEKSAELLYEVVLKEWNGRFPEIEVIALEELNNIVQKGKRSGVEEFKIDARLLKPIDVDLRIVMTWDADLTDMDLWVYEPGGDAASYQNPRTAAGGLVSRDFTQGYGPEEYMIRKAVNGTYEVKTKFYGSNSQKVAGAVTLQVDIFTNYGREDEKRRSVTLRLTEKKETFKVADIEF